MDQTTVYIVQVGSTIDGPYSETLAAIYSTKELADAAALVYESGNTHPDESSYFVEAWIIDGERYDR